MVHKRKQNGEMTKDTETTVRAIYAIELKDRKGMKDLMLILGLKEAMYQLAITNNVRWYGYVLRREDGHGHEKGIRY